MVPAICGLMAGALYRSDVGNMKQWRFPKSIQSLASKFLGSLLASPPLPRSTAVLPDQPPRMISLQGSSGNLTTSATGLRNRRTGTRMSRASVRVRFSFPSSERISRNNKDFLEGISGYVYGTRIRTGATFTRAYSVADDHVPRASSGGSGAGSFFCKQ